MQKGISLKNAHIFWKLAQDANANDKEKLTHRSFSSRDIIENSAWPSIKYGIGKELDEKPDGLQSHYTSICALSNKCVNICINNNKFEMFWQQRSELQQILWDICLLSGGGVSFCDTSISLQLLNLGVHIVRGMKLLTYHMTFVLDLICMLQWL